MKLLVINMRAWDFFGGTPYPYIYICMYVCMYVYIKIYMVAYIYTHVCVCVISDFG